MESAFTIRHAVSDDAPALARFAANAFRDTYRGLDDPDEIEDYVAEHFRLDVVASHIEDPASTVLVAEQAGCLLGYAHIELTDAPACVTGPAPIELARLYLGQDVIGKGRGAQLMRAVLAEARRLERKTLWLGVYDRNVRAVQFYKKFGFVEVGGKEFLFGGRVYIDPIMAAAVPSGD